MIPQYFLELEDTSLKKDAYKVYFDNQYPITENCIILDKQINDIQKDIDDIQKRELSHIKECNCSPISPQYGIGIYTRNISKNYLKKLLIKKTNISALADCRNKIETIRTEESATIQQQYSIAAEKSVLGESKKKQYVYIGVGIVVFLTGLFLVIKKKIK